MPNKADSGMVRDLISSALLASSANVVRQLLQVVRTHLGLDVAYVSSLSGNVWRLHAVDAPGREAEFGEPGAVTLPADETLCGLVEAGALPALMNDTLIDPIARDLDCVQALQIRASISVPVILPDGTRYGRFCAFSTTPDTTLNQRDLNIVEAFAQLTGLAIEAQFTADMEVSRKRARIDPFLQGTSDISVVLQPVWDLGAEALFGAEALSRFLCDPQRPPNQWFDEAAEIGQGMALETVALQRALGTLDELPPDVLLFVNASPSTVVDPGFAAMLRRAPLHRIMLEITEHAVVKCYEELDAALYPLRRGGLKLAIDDVGGGYSSLTHIVRLRPDLIKADKSLVRNVDICTSRRAMMAAMETFARETGTLVLGEGVETAAELATLIDLGIDLAQGFFLGRPAAPALLPATLEAGVAAGVMARDTPAPLDACPGNAAAA